ncbi:MAG: N-acetyltransferase [Candidatus Korobacteraceae bacterium]
MFVLRNYRQGDFEALYGIDRECFDAGIAYSRRELQSYIERKQSFCIVTEAPAPVARSSTAAIASAKATSQAARREAGSGDSSTPIAGFVLVEIHHKGYGHIITIDVLAEYRRRQLGTLLLQAAEERVRKIGGFAMVLETAVNNQAALAFYERHKYKVLNKLPGYYGKGLDAWFLTKRL